MLQMLSWKLAAILKIPVGSVVLEINGPRRITVQFFFENPHFIDFYSYLPHYYGYADEWYHNS